MSSQAGLHIYIGCLFINHHKDAYDGFSLNIRKHYLHKKPFSSFIYCYPIYTRTCFIYYKHDLECTGQQHENCLSVLNIKQPDEEIHRRDPEKSSFCPPKVWGQHSGTGKCLVHQPGSSLNLLLCLWRLQYIGVSD